MARRRIAKPRKRCACPACGFVTMLAYWPAREIDGRTFEELVENCANCMLHRRAIVLEGRAAELRAKARAVEAERGTKSRWGRFS